MQPKNCAFLHSLSFPRQNRDLYVGISDHLLVSQSCIFLPGSPDSHFPCTQHGAQQNLFGTGENNTRNTMHKQNEWQKKYKIVKYPMIMITSYCYRYYLSSHVTHSLYLPHQSPARLSLPNYGRLPSSWMVGTFTCISLSIWHILLILLSLLKGMHIR